MLHRASRYVCLLVVIALSGATGCQTTGSYLLSTIGLEKKPVAVALVLEEKPGAAVASLNPFPAYVPLQKALADDLGRPVAVDSCFAFQACQGLSNGWYAVAVVTPTQFARLPKDQSWRVLAAPVDPQGRVTRRAVLVVATGSPVTGAAELRGKVVAFGPRDDARTHLAALQLLREAGLEPTDLSLELLPIPGSLKHMPDMRAVAQTVINGSADAGFIDEAAWEAFAEHSQQEGEPARDKLRIIGRTVALPGRLLIASPKLDDTTARKVSAFLLATGTKHPEVLEPLGLSGYQLPDDAAITACRVLAAGETIEEPAEPPASEESGKASSAR